MTGPDAPVRTHTLTTTRFGSLTIEDNLVFSFPNGLVGFTGPRQFALIPHSPESPFLWLQDMNDGSLAFPVTALDVPEEAETGLLNRDERADLELEKDERPRLLGIVSIHAGQIRLNRLGPIVLNIRARKGRQLVLDLPLPLGDQGS